MKSTLEVSSGQKALGIGLILFIGLLNFHIPHFLVEAHSFSTASYLLELALLLNIIGAVISAIAIYRNLRWGWILGIVISVISFLLYIAQETVGLPGLPQNWFEPSRIVAVVVEVVFILLARNQLKVAS